MPRAPSFLPAFLFLTIKVAELFRDNLWNIEGPGS
jgi:hypothetical protein